MRVGDNPSVSADFSNNTSTMTLDEQITQELNVPVKEHDHPAANARRDAVRDIFANLSPDDAKELYGRLEKYNHNDPLNDKFYGTFSDETIDALKKNLKARFEPQNGGATQTTGTTQTGTASGAEKKTDVSNAGKTKADELNEQLLAKDPNAPLKIAGKKGMKDFEKQQEISQWIHNSSPDDLRKMIDASKSWPAGTQKLIYEAIENGFSGANKQKLATDLKPDQQIDMLKRLNAGGYSDSVSVLMGNADKTTLNQIAKDFKNFPGFDIDPAKNKASNTLIDDLAMRAIDLTPDNRNALADTILNQGMPQKPLPSWRSFLMEEMFDSLKGQATEQQARDLFAHIQQSGNLKNMLSNFNNEPINFQKQFLGLGKTELQAIKQTFEQLANEAPQGSHLREIYRESARSAAEWSTP